MPQVYDDLPAGSVPGQPNYARPSPNFEFVPKDGWGEIYPTLKAWKQREPGSVTPSDHWTKEEAPCIAEGDNTRTAKHFKLFYPQFAAYECCLRMVEEHEAANSMRYTYVIKTRPDISIDSAVSLPAELVAGAGTKLVVGAPYYRRNLMCVHKTLYRFVRLDDCD